MLQEDHQLRIYRRDINNRLRKAYEAEESTTDGTEEHRKAVVVLARIQRLASKFRVMDNYYSRL